MCHPRKDFTIIEKGATDRKVSKKREMQNEGNFLHKLGKYKKLGYSAANALEYPRI